MKKIFKFFVNVFAVTLSVLALFSFSACQEIKTIEVRIKIYDFANERFEDKTMTVDLYRHLAPKTVDNVISAIKDGYYDNTLFYKIADKDSQIMVGEFKIDGNNIVRQDDRATVEGEFESNGLKGSNLINEKGTIGLWRSYTAQGDYTKSDIGRNSGTAVWYIPTSNLSTYDGYFALFAKIDLDNSNNSEIFDLFEQLFANTEACESYTVFYTGEEASNLEGHVIKTADLEDDNENYDKEEKTYYDEKIYEAKGKVLASYDMTEVNIPKLKDGTRYAFISSIKIK